MVFIGVYPIIYRVSTILLVVQDFAGPSTVFLFKIHQNPMRLSPVDPLRQDLLLEHLVGDGVAPHLQTHMEMP